MKIDDQLTKRDLLETAQSYNKMPTRYSTHKIMECLFMLLRWNIELEEQIEDLKKRDESDE